MKLQLKMFLCDWSELTSSISFCETEITSHHRAIPPLIALMLFNNSKLLLETCKIYLQSTLILDSSLGAIAKRDKLKQFKEKVQRNRLTSALFDPVANTRHIENAYIEMHKRYQESTAPENFYTEKKTNIFVIN